MANETEIRTELKKEVKKSLDDDVRFSWGRVMKNGVKNMKEDVDPVYKGAKIGAYALHGIPTWAREYKDGRLANDSNGFSTIAATFVLGVTGAAYYAGTTALVAASGPVGYSLLGIPLASQLMSYTRESFRKAKKSEMGNVIQNRIQRRLTNESDEKFDLSLKDMVQAYASNVKSEPSAADTEFDPYSGSMRRGSKKKHADNPEIKAYSAVGEAAEKIFNQLFAFDQVGKQYGLYRDLSMVNKSNEKKRNEDHVKDYIDDTPEGTITKLIWDTVSRNNGSANIELLGKVTAIYKGQGAAREVHYQVEPNELWKR